jgi:hypothetical protein
VTERIVRVKPQLARDTATGAEVYSVDREHLGYELGARSWVIPIERGVGVVSLYLPRQPVWSDGRPLTADEVRSARESIELVLRDWGSQTDFVE